MTSAACSSRPTSRTVRRTPSHLDRSEYLARARSAAEEGAERNDLEPGLVDVSFPDGGSIAPLPGPDRRRGGGAVSATTTVVRSRPPQTSVSARGRDHDRLGPVSGGPRERPRRRRGAVTRDRSPTGRASRCVPMSRRAFDRMAAAARSAGVALVINSAYRSDAEQQRLWNANPDPRWVAPPGTSLHRCGTELDPRILGRIRLALRECRSFRLRPEVFLGTLALRIRRRSGSLLGGGRPARRPVGRRCGLGRWRAAVVRAATVPRPLLGAASRYGVSASLLAAQLMAESNFNPNAISPAGAQGIAQFMPATAASYGLRNPSTRWRRSMPRRG